jgi:primosomal protein N' (replication factor Y) (superfamily II helicase)
MNTKKRFADIILPFPLYKAFTYGIPPALTEQIDIGFRVVVPFGKSKYYTGIVQKIHEKEPEEFETKDIIDVFDDQALVLKEHVALWQWIADYYCCPLGDVMAAALPAHFKLESKTKICLNTEMDLDLPPLNAKESMILQALQIQKELSVKEIQDILKIKTVFPLIQSLISKNWVNAKEEISENYKAKMISCVVLTDPYKYPQTLEDLYRILEKAPKQLNILLAYQMLEKKEGLVERKNLLKKAEASSQALQALVKKGVFIEKEMRVDRYNPEYYRYEAFALNKDQNLALDQIEQAFSDKDVCFLHGVTGSGKTYIYLKIIEKYLEQGRQVLYLVPEIALTTQLIRKMLASFGDKVGIFHSRFNQHERYEIWQKLLHGELDIILGVRSAIFLPFSRLGLIIVDEEHESTYKQQDPAPRYHARDTAIYAASLFGAKTLLGSATPSLESYFNILHKKYHYIQLKSRFSEVQLPDIEIVDLRKAHFKKEMHGSISRSLLDEMQARLQKKEQIILFQNRRGYAPHLTCKTCGWSPICEHCDIKLTYHKYTGRLRCHYCGFSISMIKECKLCGSNNILMKGFGTERIEEELEGIIEGDTILRMDSDTTRSKNAHQKIITEFEKGSRGILIGTQMISKGLDFENVKLVGIINADLLLSYPDFRSEERTFQLIHQVGGRAGRRKERGKVIVQTFQPEHPLFAFVKEGKAEDFYAYELQNRTKFLYPPFVRLIEIMIKAKDPGLLDEISNTLALRLKEKLHKRILGPEYPPSVKLKDYFQKHIFCKLERNSKLLVSAKKLIRDEAAKILIHKQNKNVRIIIDVDPY